MKMLDVPATAPGALEQARLLDQADRVLPGGGLGMFALPREVDLVVAEGHGGHVTDLAGRDYIDYHLGSGPALLGHAHPEVVAAVQRQLVKGSTYYFLNEPAIALAERMVEAIPCAEQLQFAGSGSEATLYALRLARAATGREKILKFEGGWHGMNEYALWGTTPSVPSAYPHAEPDSAGIPGVIANEVLVAPFNDAARAAEIIEEHAGELAAVIVEPLQRVLRPVPGFLETVRELTRRHGIVLIFDEIVTGFRIAWGGAQELYGTVPDLATYGKAMSGGFPMAAIVGSRELLRYVDPRRTAAGERVWAGGPRLQAATLGRPRLPAEPGAGSQRQSKPSQILTQIPLLVMKMNPSSPPARRSLIVQVQTPVRGSPPSPNPPSGDPRDLAPAPGDPST